MSDCCYLFRFSCVTLRYLQYSFGRTRISFALIILRVKISSKYFFGPIYFQKVSIVLRDTYTLRHDKPCYYLCQHQKKFHGVSWSLFVAASLSTLFASSTKRDVLLASGYPPDFGLFGWYNSNHFLFSVLKR